MIVWSKSSRTELRAMNRDDAVRVLQALTRYEDSGDGDIKSLTGAWRGYLRLRVGEYRVIFLENLGQTEIVQIRHRSGHRVSNQWQVQA
jgi:mRNA-degrading endonuclease RelE of RelBE toxin-antitoxin system